MKKCLIVVDYQNDFVSGSLGFEKAKTLELGIANKINSYHVNGDDVIFTLDTHYDDYMDSYEGKHLPVPHCIENTDGHKLYGSVANCVSGEDIVFRKTTFGSDALYEYLKTACYGSVELVGVCNEYLCCCQCRTRKDGFTRCGYNSRQHAHSIK